MRPTRSEIRPAGPTASAPGEQEHGRAEAEDPFDAGDRDDRHRPERDRELDHPRLEDEPEREQERVATDGRHHAIRAAQAVGEGASAAVRRVTDVRRAERRVRRSGRPRSGAGRVRARRRTPSRPRSPRATARGSTSRCPGASGRRSRGGRSRSRPSSARTRCTIVAVASAGPDPVSCRSEVNGRPEIRAPR